MKNYFIIVLVLAISINFSNASTISSASAVVNNLTLKTDFGKKIQTDLRLTSSSAKGTENQTLCQSTVSLLGGAGYDAQTVCVGKNIRSIFYQFSADVTGVNLTCTNITPGSSFYGNSFNGTPGGIFYGFNKNSKILTIYGALYLSSSFSYTFTSKGTCTPVSISGTITATDNLVATVRLTSSVASTAQTKAVNTAISNIAYQFTGANDATFSGLPPGVGGCFQWSTKTAIIYGTPNVAGTYIYTITSAGSCTPASVSGTITVTPSAARLSSGNVSVDALEGSKILDVVAYPNPSSESFNFNLTSASEEKVSIMVYDMIGKLIDKNEVTPIELSSLQIGNHYTTGIYNVIVTQGNKSNRLRIVKR